MKLIFINHLIYMLCSIKMFNGEIENYDESWIPQRGVRDYIEF